MAHDNNKSGKTYKAVNAVSKAVNKKGKIKGKNKKETKYLKRACCHHYINHKGKLKSKFFNNSNGECICELCGRSFQTKIENKDAVREKISDAINLANQAVTAATAGGLGDKVVEKLVTMKVCLEEFPKDYSRIMKAISKEDNIKKKKKNNNNGGGSSQYGGWSHK